MNQVVLILLCPELELMPYTVREIMNVMYVIWILGI